MATSAVQIPVEIRAYLEDLIAEAQVPVFDDKAKEELIQYLFERLDRFLAAKIVENMSPEDTETFIKMNEEQKPREEIDTFLREHMTDPQEVFTRAFVDFRDFYLTAQTNIAQGKNPAEGVNQPSAPQAVDMPPAPDTNTDDPSKLPN